MAALAAVARRLSPRFVLEAVNSPCVVTKPGFGGQLVSAADGSGSTADMEEVFALINPANRALVGTAAAYFPRGGPVPVPPPPGLSTSDKGWGGLEAGPNMLYPSQAVDGLVHQLGGATIRGLLARFPALHPDEREGLPAVRCKTGSTALTLLPPGSCQGLPFDVIAHTPPPFWPGVAGDPTGIVPAEREAWTADLARCYQTALGALLPDAEGGAPWRCCVAAPLLGAGATGAPASLAIGVAIEAVKAAAKSHGERASDRSHVLLRFVLPDRRDFDAFVTQMAERCGSDVG